ncbi:(2Fe-2S)-binding protein [Temperatibacter marinus]|uniref:(2Fe-2S)-binding protein n=1 Tax=Temperatibacter marinus TaxID=1456591 RepID=A0AA52H9P2_9PROT|nr:2Fe-2S iron-sulfur cluster-binding protein [Temperatibacter marinus]WND01895.1 (2Fe-2S)-binding protein [Temperatibacter marinus]
MPSFLLNGQHISHEEDSDMPLMWYLRDIAGLTGTKYGCGVGQCSACTVHVNDMNMQSCQVRLGDIEDGAKVTTIEGLARGDMEHKLQKAWGDYNVPQCGYCQAGQIMTAAALLEQNANPSEQEIDEAMWGNICRCGTYQRIKQAIKAVVDGEVS